ncbi:MAG: hypothetical protein Q8R08_00350 [bacterium]|nr:hypothetical protein [bacterium]
MDSQDTVQPVVRPSGVPTKHSDIVKIGSQLVHVPCEEVIQYGGGDLYYCHCGKSFSGDEIFNRPTPKPKKV